LSIEDLFKDEVVDPFNGAFNYFYYQGSLTSPPCDEHVNWFIVDEKINFGFS